MAEKKVDHKQKVLIHIAKAQLGLGDEAYRDLLMARYPGCFEGSCKELSYKEAENLINHFKGMGFVIKKKPRPKRPSGIPEVFTDKHPMAGKIARLKADIRWRFEDGYERFIKKMLKKDRITTTAEASKVIEALKAMRARQSTGALHRAGNISGGGWSW